MFGRGLSRYLPSAMRPGFVAVASRVLRRIDDVLSARDLSRKRKPAPTPYRGDRVAIVGFIHEPTGLGRGARLMHEAFTRRGRTAAAFDVAPLLQRHRAATRAEIARLTAFAPTDIILHVNPPSFRSAVRRLPLTLTERVCVVGYWAWELDRLPPHWRTDSTLCDTIWTPSDFVADAVRASLPEFRGDVRVEPHAVDIDPFARASDAVRRAARVRLGVREDAFVAGYSFTMAGNFSRKNPLAAIEAFQRAFASSATAPAVLLLRCPDAGGFAPGRDALRAAALADPRIRVLGRDEAPLLVFYQALDVYLSLHRGEGYGLQLMEALQVGAEVVATGWGLSTDILAQPGFHAIGSTLVPVVDPQGVYARIPGAAWAAPDVAQAGAVLADIAARRRPR